MDTDYYRAIGIILLNKYNNTMSDFSRRKFLKTGAAALAGITIAPNSILGMSHGHISPSDKLNILGIGIGGRGASAIRSMSSQNIIGLCDVDWKYSGHVFDEYPKAKRYYDYRKMFDELGKSADAVMIATPDHTHALIAAEAITMGKHIYCEKPLTHTVYESRLLTKLADKYNIDVNSVTDFNTLYDALKTVKEGEGGSPYFMSKNGANFLLNLNYDDLSSGLPAIGVKYGDDSKTVVNPLDDEEILSNLDIVRKMYQEGIINGDAPTADDSSKYAMFFAAQGWSGAAKTTWGPNNGIANCSAVQYGNTVVSNTTVRGSINGIYSGCKHPDKALQLLNLVNTDSKVRDWFYYGAEGTDFEYTDDNKVHRLTTDWGMAGYTQGTFFNVTQTDDVDFNQWDEVEELNENATPSEMLGFNLDTSNIETELANCRAVYEKYYSELFTGAQDPRELVKTIDAELETAGWETIREEAQKQIDAQK